MARPYNPQPYHPQPTNTWFLARWPYTVFVLRELSAAFLAAYGVVLLVLVMRVHEGRAAYEGFVSTLQSPLLVAFHIVALAFALLHTVTWFQAVPKGLPLRLGERRVDPRLLIGASYGAMAAVTVVVIVALVA